MLFCSSLNMDRVSLYANYNKILDEEEKQKIKNNLNKKNDDNKIKDYLESSIKFLKKYNIEEAALITELIFSKVLNIDRMLLFTIYTKDINEEQKNEIKKYLIQISQNIPYQYIFNKQNFYGRDFYVDKGVLIPRYDTEVLVEKVIKLCNGNENILDIGTGSGVIAITIGLELKDTKILAVDISDKAIEIANKNKKILDAKNVKIIKSDLFENINFSEFDIIVSNPPYISNEQINEMSIDTIEYEPYEALFAQNDGLYFYYEISKRAINYLKKGGYLAFEIGYKQKDAIVKILEELKYIDIVSYKDLNNHDRVIIARKG